MSSKKLSAEALTVLGSMIIDNTLAKITAGQLDRKLYVEVNKALEALGGKWNKKLGGHVFTEDARDALDQVVLTGEFSDKRQDFGFFETPDPLAWRLVEMADLRSGMRVIEPSAGRGALLRRIFNVVALNVTAVEVQPENYAHLVRTFGDAHVLLSNFLDFATTDPFDRVVMNPPFARQADIDHVNHAYKMLRPGGRLVSIMSAGITFRQTAKAEALRVLIEERGEIIKLPPDSFRESGTGVRTVIVRLDKPA